ADVNAWQTFLRQLIKETSPRRPKTCSTRCVYADMAQRTVPRSPTISRKSTLLLAFVAAWGCSSAPTPTTKAPAEAVSLRANAEATPATPGEPTTRAETLAQADQAYDSQLGISRGDHFETERQIMVLRQAVLLYTQFLERAEGRPELEPAVRKSRERIE